MANTTINTDIGSTLLDAMLTEMNETLGNCGRCDIPLTDIVSKSNSAGFKAIQTFACEHNVCGRCIDESKMKKGCQVTGCPKAHTEDPGSQLTIYKKMVDLYLSYRNVISESAKPEFEESSYSPTHLALRKFELGLAFRKSDLDNPSNVNAPVGLTTELVKQIAPSLQYCGREFWRAIDVPCKPVTVSSEQIKKIQEFVNKMDEEQNRQCLLMILPDSVNARTFFDAGKTGYNGKTLKIDYWDRYERYTIDRAGKASASAWEAKATGNQSLLLITQDILPSTKGQGVGNIRNIVERAYPGAKLPTFFQALAFAFYNAITGSRSLKKYTHATENGSDSNHRTIISEWKSDRDGQWSPTIGLDPCDRAGIWITSEFRPTGSNANCAGALAVLEI